MRIMRMRRVWEIYLALGALVVLPVLWWRQALKRAAAAQEEWEPLPIFRAFLEALEREMGRPSRARQTVVLEGAIVLEEGAPPEEVSVSIWAQDLPTGGQQLEVCALRENGTALSLGVGDEVVRFNRIRDLMEWMEEHFVLQIAQDNQAP